MRRCPQCEMSYDESGYYGETTTYCILCSRYNALTKYRAARLENRKKYRARESALKATQYQEKKKLNPTAQKYRTPRCLILREEPVKPPVWCMSFD